MEGLIEILRADVISLSTVKEYFECKVFDINACGSMAMDIVYDRFLCAIGYMKHVYYDILLFLVMENSCWPTNFSLLGNNCELNDVYSFCNNLHTLLPNDIANELSKYHNLYYFFDKSGHSYLYRCLKRGDVIHPCVSSRLLLSSYESDVTTNNLLLRMKSVISIRTSFENASLKQEYCCIIDKLPVTSDVDYRALSAVLKYPKIMLFFDFSNKQMLKLRETEFLIGCNGKKLVLSLIVDFIIKHLFGSFNAFVYDEYNKILAYNIEYNDMYYFKRKLNEKDVIFRGNIVKFGLLNLRSVDKKMIYDVLFNKNYEIVKSEVVNCDNELELKYDEYTRIKIVPKSIDMKMLYNYLSSKYPLFWIDYDVKYDNNIFMDLYEQRRVILLFDNVSLDTVINEYNCECWIKTDTIPIVKQLHLNLVLIEPSEDIINYYSEKLHLKPRYLYYTDKSVALFSRYERPPFLNVYCINIDDDLFICSDKNDKYILNGINQTNICFVNFI